MDALNFIYNTFIVGLPFKNYDTMNSTRFKSLSNQDKVKEVKKSYFESKHSSFIYLILDKKPELLTEEETVFLQNNNRQSKQLLAMITLIILPSFSYFLYNVALKQKYYYKIYIYSNLGSFFIYSIISQYLNASKFDKIYKKYSDIFPLEEYIKLTSLD